jgi:hypothetical protein
VIESDQSSPRTSIHAYYLRQEEVVVREVV